MEDPWSGALLEHERCTESWPAGDAAAAPAAVPAVDAPVVPLDAGVLLSFAQPMDDETAVADNPPGAAPVVPIGEHDATYTLVDLTPAPSAPQPPRRRVAGRHRHGLRHLDADAGDAGSRLQLLAR